MQLNQSIVLDAPGRSTASPFHFPPAISNMMH